MSHAIPQSQTQLPLCEICKFQPAPQSVQKLPLMLLQVLLIFINIKFSIILLFLGYCFSQTTWKCPVCKRTIEVDKSCSQNLEADSNIIIRMGKCIGMISRPKFRVVSAIIIFIMFFLYLRQPSTSSIKPKVKIENTWESLVKNCGYEAYMENSYHANFLYTQYVQSGHQWTIEALYIDSQNLLKGLMYKKLKVKMNPSQFADPQMHDFSVLIRESFIQKLIPFQKGQILKITGTWQGRIQHQIIFSAKKVQKTGNKMQPEKVKLINFGKLRINE